MTRSWPGSVTRIVGWLLTPLVVWAASFSAGWVAAAVTGELPFLVMGSVLGGAIGLVAWAMLVRWEVKRRERGAVNRERGAEGREEAGSGQ